jgi:ABC-type sugar transport system ATPase subunit
MEPVIRLSNVSRRFGRVKAFDDVSLNIQPGTVGAVLGSNGAGKSTLIRLLLGFESADTR